MSKLIIRITKYSLGFRAEALDPSASSALLAFASRFVQKSLQIEQGVSKMVPVAVFASSNSRREYYNFHIGSYNKFLESLEARGLRENIDYEIIRTPMYTPRKVDLKFNPKFILRDTQDAAKEFLKKTEIDDTPALRKLVGIQTGGGKTAVASAA